MASLTLANQIDMGNAPQYQEVFKQKVDRFNKLITYVADELPKR